MADEQTFTKEQLDAAVSAQVDGLKTKNQELLGKLAKTKGVDKTEFDRLKGIETKFDEMRTKAEEEQGEFKKLYGTTKEELETAKTTWGSEKTKLEGEIKVMKKQMEINKALSAHKVIPGMHDIAVSTILPNVAIDDDGKAMVGSKKVGDYVDNWFKGDVGKHFILNDKTGGGANGSDTGESNAEQAGWYKKGSPTYNLTKQGQLAKSDPELHSKLVKSSGN